ncbi:TA system VapC family ribonuclease toxin [Rhodoferax sp.]|uniref:TA system VapC family ribonuclease toxin n=1 Tax=Rhodoferax sp. TaxID=50421 RepID=UPI00275E36CA|nr:VapC toxin family PIN domain ribonuclease [Rhodoferax sp.]
MRALLDINVLIALHDRDHVHHAHASSWLAANMAQGWASCPLTQNGCLRIMSQSGYSNPQPLSVLMPMLQRSTTNAHHHFWSDDISLLDAARFNQGFMHSPRQLTDLYLLGLAVKQGARLVSFDQRIPLSAVQGASTRNLVTL